MAAAGRGHTEIVRLLLASPGIDINAQDYVSFNVYIAKNNVHRLIKLPS